MSSVASQAPIGESGQPLGKKAPPERSVHFRQTRIDAGNSPPSAGTMVEKRIREASEELVRSICKRPGRVEVVGADPSTLGWDLQKSNGWTIEALRGRMRAGVFVFLIGLTRAAHQGRRSHVHPDRILLVRSEKRLTGVLLLIVRTGGRKTRHAYER